MPRRILLTLALLLSFSGWLAADSPAERLMSKPDSWFVSQEGRTAMDCILSWQSEHGSWPKNQDTTSNEYAGDRSKLKGTFDNGATVGELRALARAFTATEDERYKAAFLRGFDHILKAQYPNGGWPQYFPLANNYPRHITFNDGSMIAVMEFLRDSLTPKGAEFLDADRQEAARAAIERGIDCILKCQVIVEGTPTVWCAQHDEVTLKPAKGRAYELPSLSGSESTGILKFLMRINEPSAEVISAVENGAAWFESTKLTGFRYDRIDKERLLIADPSAEPLWARFYEIETNRPFFCDRDGIVKYSLDEIGAERRNGYSWYGNWGKSMLSQYAKWKQRLYESTNEDEQ